MGETVPPILIDGHADHVDVPIGDGFLDLGHEGPTGRRFPRSHPFGGIHVNPGQTDGTTAAGGDDMVTHDLQLGRSGKKIFGMKGGQKKGCYEKRFYVSAKKKADRCG